MKSHPIIINSAEYINSQLNSEFGEIPPSFLPLGGIRLYEHQHLLLRGKFSRIILSLPEDFQPSFYDILKLKKLKIEIVPTPAGLSLGDSIVYSLELAKCKKGPVSLLHGDTLIKGIDFNALDIVSISNRPAGYDWGEVETINNRILKIYKEPHQTKENYPNTKQVLSGWFSISNSNLLFEEIKKKQGDFIQGLSEYSKKINVHVAQGVEWYDFGHSNTYHQSKQKITTQRKFNKIHVQNRIVKKSSDIYPKKIMAELNWYKSLPSKLRLYTPALLEYDTSAEKNASYSLPYIYLPTLSDLYVFGRLSLDNWRLIFKAIKEVLDNFKEYKAPKKIQNFENALYYQKTIERLKNYSALTGLNLKKPCQINGIKLPSIENMVLITSEAIKTATANNLTIIHGDFCFSNLFYDNRSNQILLIDPRGVDAFGNTTIYGDRRYDIAKLYQSVVGKYDHIVSGYYDLKTNSQVNFDLNLPNDSFQNDIEIEFEKSILSNSYKEDYCTLPITILLFFSMLPLHSDNPKRQAAFLANAMKMFATLTSSSQKNYKKAA
jgi:hypothetical protein